MPSRSWANRPAVLAQRIEIVRLRIPDRRIETPFAVARGEHVPDADAVLHRTLETRAVRELVRRSPPSTSPSNRQNWLTFWQI
nr:hypothetical protein [Burkholderia ubonensis]